MKTEWYDSMIQTLQLNGKGERTQEAYARAVRMLLESLGKAPDEITAEELQAYFLHRGNVSRWSPATLRICYAGIRFFFEKVLHRDWPLLTILRAQRERKLPAVLSVEEVRRTLGGVTTFHNQAFLTTVYSCGLRLQEGLHLGTLRELIRTFGPESLATHQEGMPAAHRKVLQALMVCRTAASGVTGYACSQCGEVHRIFCSCGNRHCPQC